MVLNGVVSNGVKWCQVSVMTLESLLTREIADIFLHISIWPGSFVLVK